MSRESFSYHHGRPGIKTLGGGEKKTGNPAEWRHNIKKTEEG